MVPTALGPAAEITPLSLGESHPTPAPRQRMIVDLIARELSLKLKLTHARKSLTTSIRRVREGDLVADWSQPKLDRL